MMDILISKVRVKITRSEFATYTYKRYHGISAGILAIKRDIGLEKGKAVPSVYNPGSF